MQYITWQDLIQVGSLLGMWATLACTIYFNTRDKK